MEKPDKKTESEPTIEWTTHPVKRRPVISVLVTIFVFVISMIVYYITTSKTFGVLAMVIMFASLAKFYFPTTYRLTREGISIKTTTQTLRKNWSMYRSCYPDKKGILLSPFVRPSRLENFRGIYLMFADNRDEVTNFVKAHIGKSDTRVGQDPCKIVTKDGYRTARRAGACLPPVAGGHKARRYANMEKARFIDLNDDDTQNQPMSQPPCDPDTSSRNGDDKT